MPLASSHRCDEVQYKITRKGRAGPDTWSFRKTARVVSGHPNMTSLLFWGAGDERNARITARARHNLLNVRQGMKMKLSLAFSMIAVAGAFAPAQNGRSSTELHSCKCDE